MPLYLLKCDCGHREEVYRSFRDYDDLPQHCGKTMQRVICPPMVAPDIQPYKSMIDGQIINSRSAHREHLRAHGCIEVGNEKLASKKPEPPPGLTETLVRVANEKLRR